MERHFFPGANTPVGFYNNFSNVWNYKNDSKAIHIKGGSGCGKSTIMKNIASRFKEKGFEIEYMHCSSDPDSLDGIHIVGKSFVVFDSTAPHMQDPSLAGFKEIIFDTGNFLNKKFLDCKQEKLLNYMYLKKLYFSECYRFLAAAQLLYPPNKDCNFRLVHNIAQMYDQKNRFSPMGKERKLFATAISPEGTTNFLDTILEGKVIGITDSDEGTELLKEISLRARINGYDVDTYYCPMFPETKPEHIVIRGADLSFTTINSYHHYEHIEEKIKMPPKRKPDEEIKHLVDSAKSSLKKAKSAHREIEKVYIEAMDFEKMNEKTEELYEFLEF